MLVAWSDQVHGRVTSSIEFYLEMQVDTSDEQELYWVIFVYTSTEAKVRNR